MQSSSRRFPTRLPSINKVPVQPQPNLNDAAAKQMVVPVQPHLLNHHQPFHIHAVILLDPPSVYIPSGRTGSVDLYWTDIRVQDDQAVQAAYCTVCGHYEEDCYRWILVGLFWASE